MSRDIKFKAYLKKIHKIVEVSEINFRKGWIEYYDYETQEYVDYGGEDTDELLESDEIVLMQYTGLKDKNGKEIYNGDIVKFNNQIGEICFECGAFGIGVKDCVDYETLETYRGERFYGCLNDNFISLWEIYWNLNCVDSEIDEIEVIGNIYENPELLEVK